jgi:transposase
VHDFWSAYQSLPCRHSYCNAHLLRELKSMEEHGGHRWGGQISGVLMEMKSAVAQACAHGLAEVPASTREDLHARYNTLVAGALQAHPENLARPPGSGPGRIRQSAEYNLLSRLERHRREVLRFFDEPGVPFDNNQAERDLRMLKVQQKTSGCFRNVTGAERFCTLRSYVSTAKKLGLKLLDSIADAFRGSPFSVPFPET